MRKGIYIGFIALLFSLTAVLNSCKDDDFENKPNGTDVAAIEITPQHGALLVKWTPDPLDTNFVFLNIKMTDQDGKERNYNVSRYSSSVADTTGTATEEAASIVITKLVNQEYKLDFYAYNNTNHSIDLGSRTATPLDYSEVLPDTVSDVKVTGAKKRLILEWRDPEIGSWSTFKLVRFTITNTETGEVVVTKEYPVGVRHDSIDVAPGLYDVEIESVSQKGQIVRNATAYNGIEVRLADEVRLFDQATRAGWKLSASSVEVYEGSLEAIVDGQAGTYWHSDWSTSSPNYPHWITVELDKTEHIGGFIFQQRQAAPSRHILDYKIYTKENEGDEYVEVLGGTLADNDDVQDIKLRAGVVAKYIKLEFLNGTSQFACLAEFGLIVFEE